VCAKYLSVRSVRSQIRYRPPVTLGRPQRLFIGVGSLIIRDTTRAPYDSLMAKFFLLHSPVVGPTTWKWVSEELQGIGHEVKILTISPSATFRGWEGVVEEVVAQVTTGDDAIFVAHSGAGPLLPTIVDRLNARGSSMVFVDAGLPAIATNTPLMPEAFLKQLSAIAEEGLLPPWSTWFGPNVIDTLIPDSIRRELIEFELPRIPLSYFYGSVPPIQRWPADRNGYVLLSDSYLDDAEEARRRGWPVVALLGKHLDLVSKAPNVALAVVQVSSLN
jgi:hypothetical protein